LTPKQAFLFHELGKRLEDNGHTVLNTTRKYREVNQVIELKGISAKVVGEYGGSTLEGKLIASVQRIEELTKIVDKNRPDISISFSSPEAARTAFGLAIPHYAVNDSPHSVAVARLTIPLSEKLFAPKIIPKEAWTNFGLHPERIVQYDALDPVAWLKNLQPDRTILDKLGLDKERPIIVFRTEEAFASYLVGHVPENRSVITPIIKSLISKYNEGIQVVAITRYKHQGPALKAAFKNRVIVPTEAVDGPNLLFHSSIFIGAGGTMTAEAALLGLPAISCYPREPTIVEEYLIKQNLITRINDPMKAAEKIIEIVEDIEYYSRDQKQKAEKLMSKMEDPVTVITKTIESEYSTPHSVC